MKPSLNGFLSDIESSGGFGYAHAFDGSEHEDDSIDFGKRLDGALEDCSEFVVVRLPFGIFIA